MAITDVNNTMDEEYTMDNEEYTTNDEAGHENAEEDRITIEDINIMREMNMSQMAMEQEEGRDIEEAQESTTHGYNSSKRPTRCTNRVSMTQTGHTTGVDDIMTTGVEDNIMTIHPKTHVHIMLTQVNAKQGLLKYGEKGSEAISKELRQLHNTQAPLPIRKEDLSYKE